MKKVMLAGKQVTFRTKISNSKKQLAKIISENGGWASDRVFAAQDKDDYCIWFYYEKPIHYEGRAYWNGAKGCSIIRDELLPNWHQTILSRDEYFHLYPAPDAVMAKAEEPEHVWTNPPTIEQLAADYRNKLAIAQQAQEEADSHRCGAEAALDKLVAAGKALGLVLSVAAPEPEPEKRLRVFRNEKLGPNPEYNNNVRLELCAECGHRFGVHSGDANNCPEEDSDA